MWDIDAGLLLVRTIQQDIRKFGFHVAIGGGVVNNGFSEKDLDLYFLPMGGFTANWRRTSNPGELLKYLENLWGLTQAIGNDNYGDREPLSAYRKAAKFYRNKQERIDCFIF
jgi:hypothetical protein